MQKHIVLGECEVSTGCSMREYEQQTIEEVVASANMVMMRLWSMYWLNIKDSLEGFREHCFIGWR